MTKYPDYEFASLSEIELKKMQELEEEINRKMRVNSGRKIYLLAFTAINSVSNESGESNVESEPLYSH